MITAYNKVTKLLTSVEHSYLLKPASDWVINPLISDLHELQTTPTDLWVYEEDTTVLRVMTPTEQETDPTRVQHAKDMQLQLISSDCQRNIVAGFPSSALGTEHWYDAETTDQMNMISAIAVAASTPENPNGLPTFYPCREMPDHPKEFEVHSYAQLRKVASDGGEYRNKLLQKYAFLKYQIQQATTVSQIKSIVWSAA